MNCLGCFLVWSQAGKYDGGMDQVNTPQPQMDIFLILAIWQLVRSNPPSQNICGMRLESLWATISFHKQSTAAASCHLPMQMLPNMHLHFLGWVLWNVMISVKVQVSNQDSGPMQTPKQVSWTKLEVSIDT